MSAPCPKPTKHAYATREAALDGLATLRSTGKAYTGTRVYQCPCSAWHLGRSHKERVPRVKPQRSAANKARR